MAKLPQREWITSWDFITQETESNVAIFWLLTIPDSYLSKTFFVSDEQIRVQISLDKIIIEPYVADKEEGHANSRS